MKWVIVIVLASQALDANVGSNFLRLDKKYESLERCSREASNILQTWRDEYEELGEMKSERFSRLKTLVESEFDDEGIKEIEKEIREKKLEGEQVVEFLRLKGKDKLADYASEINELKSWKLKEQAKLVGKAEVVCVPAMD